MLGRCHDCLPLGWRHTKVCDIHCKLRVKRWRDCFNLLFLVKMVVMMWMTVIKSSNCQSMTRQNANRFPGKPDKSEISFLSEWHHQQGTPTEHLVLCALFVLSKWVIIICHFCINITWQPLLAFHLASHDNFLNLVIWCHVQKFELTHRKVIYWR